MCFNCAKYLGTVLLLSREIHVPRVGSRSKVLDGAQETMFANYFYICSNYF